TANQRAGDVSELMWLKELDNDTYAKLAPVVAALPDGKLPINVNTANAPTLTSISQRLPLTRAEALVESPREFMSLEAATAEIPELGDAGGVVAPRSSYLGFMAPQRAG